MFLNNLKSASQTISYKQSLKCELSMGIKLNLPHACYAYCIQSIYPIKYFYNVNVNLSHPALFLFPLSGPTWSRGWNNHWSHHLFTPPIHLLWGVPFSGKRWWVFEKFWNRCFWTLSPWYVRQKNLWNLNPQKGHFQLNCIFYQFFYFFLGTVTVQIDCIWTQCIDIFIKFSKSIWGGKIHVRFCRSSYFTADFYMQCERNSFTFWPCFPTPRSLQTFYNIPHLDQLYCWSHNPRKQLYNGSRHSFLL